MAIRENIACKQGTTFECILNVTYANGSLVDLSTYTANAVFKKEYTAQTAINFTTATTNGGKVTLSLDANTTANTNAGRYFYDCHITDANGAVISLAEGIFTITDSTIV